MRADSSRPRAERYRRFTREEDAIPEIQEWRLVGDWFDACKCSIPCPCTFAQAPTEDDCDGILAWQIREGHYGDVTLDGLNVVALGWFEGNIWGGAAGVSLGMYIDERADERQREALQVIFSGRGGGWPGEFSKLVDEVRGIEYAPITIDIADDLSSWSAEVPGVATAQMEALTGPTTLPGKRVKLHNAPGAEVGPGQVATWGKATMDRAEGFGFSWERQGRSSKHFPFDWSGPS